MPRVVALLLGAVLLLVLFFAWHPTTPVHPGTALFLGDSITAGYGLDPSEAYPNLIQLPGMTAQNLGVAGSTSADGLQRLRDYLAANPAPSLVIIALGANDILHHLPADSTEANLTAAVQECKARRIPVLLCGVKIPFAFDTAQTFQTVATRTHTPLVADILMGEAFHDDLMQEDHMHPTAEGQKQIADQLRAALEANFSFGK